MAFFITTLLRKDFAKTYNSNFWNIYCLCSRELNKKKGTRYYKMIHTLPMSFHPLNKRIGYFSTVLFHKSNQSPVCPLLKGKREENVTASKKQDPNGEKTLLFSLFGSSVMNETLVGCIMSASKDYHLSITPKAVNHVRFLFYHRSENYLQHNRKFRER